MASKKSITVVGGGLAGLTLGIGLRQRSVPVTVWEAGYYPRHRVCGEFISGRGQGSLKRLGLHDLIFQSGAISLRTTAFFSAQSHSPVRELPEPAISISRFVLDDLLAKEFKRLGGQLLEKQRWRFSDDEEGIVRATGRRAQSTSGGWRWYGLKAHARNVSLSADLEMHLSPTGYLGISWLKDGEVNICGLFRRPVVIAGANEIAPHLPDALRGAPGSLLNERMRDAVFDEASFCSVAGLSLQPYRAIAWKDCSIGDAITMIPPVTGNGMSMAFESAEIAIEPLAAFSEGRLDWTEAKQQIAQRCDKAFADRLAWAGRLQKLMFMPRLQNLLVRWVPKSEKVWRALLEKTR